MDISTGILIFLLGSSLIVLYNMVYQRYYWKMIAYTLYDDLIEYREKECGKKLDSLTYHVSLQNGKSFEFTIGTKSFSDINDPNKLDL